MYHRSKSVTREHPDRSQGAVLNDFEYETDQIISIIKNKRAVGKTLRSILFDIAGSRSNLSLLDPFCGSGSVSRLGRSMGFDVLANDIEPFLYIPNYVYLYMVREDLSSMFPSMGGIDAYYSFLNLHGMYAASTGNCQGRALISNHYAPSDSIRTRPGKERIYFSRENALFIDAVRDEVETTWMEGKISAAEKAVVLSSLLYQCSLRANTSGTFTSYHKHLYKDGVPIRSRITDMMELTIPVLLDDDGKRAQVSQEDALRFVKGKSADIAFIDPPSSAQQYGSAYHLLNSVVLWDDFVPSHKVDSDGKLADKSGIRSDWKNTHSPFCSLKHSYKAMYSLLQQIDCGQLILSYPSNGILSTEQIYELLSYRHGEIQCVALPKKRGGGRSSIDKTVGVDQLFITGKVPSLSFLLPEGLERMELVSSIESHKNSIFYPVEEEFEHFSFIEKIMIDSSPDYSQFVHCSLSELKKISDTFSSHAAESSVQSLRLLLGVYGSSFDNLSSKHRLKMEKRMISIIRAIFNYERTSWSDTVDLISSFEREYTPIWEHRQTCFSVAAHYRDRMKVHGHSGENQL